MSKPKPAIASVRFDYHSAYNEIVGKQYVSSSLYYVKHWLKALGPNGHLIVTVMRSHGYYDSSHGNHRGALDIDQKTLAGECGLSLSTFQREFLKNAALALFVQREFMAVRDSAGRILREHYVYRVKMDDPLTPEDQAQFEAMLEGRDKTVNHSNQTINNQTINIQSVSNQPIRQSDISDQLPMRQFDASAQQIDIPTRQSDQPTRQIDTLYKESLTLNTLETLNTPPADGGSLALFQERETASVWSQLTETEQQPYRLQAEQELIAMVGLAEWPKLRASGRDRQVTSRAETLYKAAMKESGTLSSFPPTP